MSDAVKKLNFYERSLSSRSGENVSHMSLVVLVVIYMFFQYFAVPVVNYFTGVIASNLYWITAFIGFFSFVLGALFASQLAQRLYKNPTKIFFIDRKNIPVLYFSGIFFISLGVLLKLKSCHLVANQLDCNQYFERVMKPNYLYVSAACCFLSALFLEIKIKFQLKSMLRIIFLMLFVGFFIGMSGTGRTLFMAFALSFVIGVYSLFPKARKIKYLILLCIAVLGSWVLISYIKELSYPSSVSGPGMNISFMYVKVINRISQYHILDAVLKNWPKEFALSFYGWQDFFSLPSVFDGRVYLDGNDFGHMTKVLGGDDFVTGIAPTFIGDLYTRGGIFSGVMLGMFLIGFLCRCFDYLLCALPFGIAVCLSMIMIPIILHGTEDFIFITFSISLLMLSFYLVVFMIMGEIVGRYKPIRRAFYEK